MSEAQRILVVDDDLDMQQFLQRVLSRDGYQMTLSSSASEALDLIKSKDSKFDIILSDIRMPLGDGHSLVKELKALNDETPVILMTAFGTIQMAVEAIKNGAHDFLTKPIQINDLKETLQKTIEYSRVVLTKEPPSKRAPSEKVGSTNMNLIGESSSMKRIFTLIHRLARVDSTVLILGESGTGKEVIAREIHRQSPRKNKNFIAINCTAIPAELLESELFGHAKGSFTGATVQKKGLFEDADGGTLFLDEIGDMPAPLQAKLLRVLQDRTIRPVGSNISKTLDVRIIAATHRDLRSALMDGHFREDLYYRLSVLPVILPPLRERREDIRPLTIHFAKRASGPVNEGYKTFSEDALAKLENFPWKGNVRELENVIERCLVMCPRNVIKAEDLQFLNDISQPLPSTTSSLVNEDKLCLKEVEREAVLLALKKTDGKKEEAARLLGIDRKTLYRKEKEYELGT